MYVNDIIGNEEGRKYQILDLLGQGTFGQVVKCINLKTRDLCAVKVIKNQPAYFNQSMMEVTVLEMLNQKYDREDRRHIARMRDTFIFRQHLCIVVELLSLNLYELIKQNGYRGFSLGLCRVFLAQILDALTVLKEARIIHCDLKPENILLKSLEAPIIKCIDFGSACHEHQTVYTYIQSRFYRSPEIILGLPYTSSIDMWSVGCIAAELFLGLPIFPGCSNYDQISRIVESLGLPPHHMLEMGKDTLTYFDKFPAQPPGRTFAMKTRERFAFETGRPEPPPKKYFASTAFPAVILNYPMKSSLSPADRDAELMNRRCFADFVGGLLNLNPLERWNPYQAMQHPFITGKVFSGPFQPTLPMLTEPSLPHQLVAPSQQPLRSRPRSNTLATLSFQPEVPAQLQKLAAASKAQPAPPPVNRRNVPDDPQQMASSYEGPGLFGEHRRSSIIQQSSQPMMQQPQSTPTQAMSFYTPTNARLSAYVNNRRVSNPPAMFQAAQAFSANATGMPSSLPTQTGFFHYHSESMSPGMSPGRRGSIGTNGAAGSSTSRSTLRRNSTLSATMHRIDESVQPMETDEVSIVDAADDDDGSSEANDSVFNVNEMETDLSLDGSKRQRKRT